MFLLMGCCVVRKKLLVLVFGIYSKLPNFTERLRASKVVVHFGLEVLLEHLKKIVMKLLWR